MSMVFSTVLHQVYLLYNYLSWQWEREIRILNASLTIARLECHRTKSLGDSLSLETNRGTFAASDLTAGGYTVMMQLCAKILKGKIQENLAGHHYFLISIQLLNGLCP